MFGTADTKRSRTAELTPHIRPHHAPLNPTAPQQRNLRSIPIVFRLKMPFPTSWRERHVLPICAAIHNEYVAPTHLTALA